MDRFKSLVTPHDECEPTAYTRAGAILMLAIALPISMAFNVRSIYWFWSVRHYGIIHTATLAVEVALSAALLSLLLTVVGCTGMVVYSAVHWLVQQYVHLWTLRTFVTWGVVTFWAVFAVDAASKAGVRVTSWVARKIEEGGEGRIRLPEHATVAGSFRQQVSLQ
ncbi:hypothetical protein Micbo1qcDRAFT_210145 [Microdochium bolleyi]|uniref:Uncharacterized protein n=1 Tax=Microdochium bolleyi TaxID=196109 RepID=A0A136IJT9_9PEZI|nr:hypothetical protein Micbo1qcDRAFT_210145 [Microdochium bolleyi]